MKIGIDIMGGDLAPHAPIDAALKYAKNNKNDIVVLFGSQEAFDTIKNKPVNMEFRLATEVIEVTDEPALSIKAKPDSSIVVAAKAAKINEIDGFISAGSTGALVAAGVLIIRRIKGINRPSLPGVFPTKINNKKVTILDLGAHSDADPVVMMQHAHMATIYVREVLKVKNPTAKLINIGEEATKGTEVYKQAYKLMEENDDINFKGNIEARYLFDGETDIAVADGFVGNMILKTVEGTVSMFSSSLKDIFKTNILTMMSALLIKSKFADFKKKLDYKEIGGTPIFGIEKLVIKAHGSSNEKAFYNALKQAKTMHEQEFIKIIKEEINNG